MRDGEEEQQEGSREYRIASHRASLKSLCGPQDQAAAYQFPVIRPRTSCCTRPWLRLPRRWTSTPTSKFMARRSDRARLKLGRSSRPRSEVPIPKRRPHQPATDRDAPTAGDRTPGAHRAGALDTRGGPLFGTVDCCLSGCAGISPTWSSPCRCLRATQSPSLSVSIVHPREVFEAWWHGWARVPSGPWPLLLPSLKKGMHNRWLRILPLSRGPLHSIGWPTEGALSRMSARNCCIGGRMPEAYP